MAFAETRTAGGREILETSEPVLILLAELVFSGDCLGYSSGWIRSAAATGEHPLLVALDDGAIGDYIKASQMAVVKVTTTATNVAGVGDIVALSDTGDYQVASAGLPDVGFVASIGDDDLSATMVICPQVQQLTSVRA